MLPLAVAMRRKLDKQNEHHGGDHRHGRAVAGPGTADQIERIGLAADLRAVVGCVRHKLREEALRLEIHEIVSAEEQQRRQYHRDAAVLQLQADPRHDPAQRA